MTEPLGAAVDSGFRRYPRRLAPHTRRFSRGTAVFFGAACAVLAALVAWREFAGGEALGGLIAVNIGGILSLASFGLIPQPPPRRSFRFLNATVLTRAEFPTADSWVHVAPTRPLRATFLVALFWAVVAMLATAVFAGLQVFGVVPRLNENVSEAGPLLGMVFFAALGGVTAWIGYLHLARRLRFGTYGRRPSGVTLGASGIAVRVPGRDVEIAWEDIRAVEPHAASMGSRERVEMIRLPLRGGLVAGDVQMLAADGYVVPTDALYTALAWYFEHPDARWELGRIEGSRRLDGWVREATAVRDAAPV